MINTFADKRTKQIFKGIVVKKLDTALQKKVLRRLRYIDAADQIQDLRIPPSNNLEKKEGEFKDYYAIWVNKQWRIIFKWVNNKANDVQLIDYH